MRVLPTVLFLGVAACPLAVAPAPAAAAPRAPRAAAPASPLAALPIRRETLDNGLRVVLSRQPGIPTVAISVIYDVGSRNELEGRSGFAHLFEHMMFEGSENVGPREHSALIESRGGEDNGTTNEDRTLYFETLPSNELALGLFLEADRMRALAVTEETYENQRATVMEERRMRYDNEPYVGSFLRLHELVYDGYFPYSHSVIGDMADLEAAPLAWVQEFFDTYYAPNNAILAIAGDFDEDAAMALVHAHFDAIPRRAVPVFEPPAYTPPPARAEQMTDRLAGLPAAHVAFPIPPARTPDHYALEMMMVAIADGDSSRMYQELVKERELLSELSAYTEDLRGPDTLAFFGVVGTGHTAEEGRDAMVAILDEVARRGVGRSELARARARMRSSFLLGLESNLARANHLAEMELVAGDATALRTELDRYLAVSEADIRRVASAYLRADRRFSLLVVPAEETVGGAP